MIIRDDEEIGYLHKMDNFDFNYQQSYDLYPNIILKKVTILKLKTLRIKNMLVITFLKGWSTDNKLHFPDQDANQFHLWRTKYKGWGKLDLTRTHSKLSTLKTHFSRCGKMNIYTSKIKM